MPEESPPPPASVPPAPAPGPAPPPPPKEATEEVPTETWEVRFKYLLADFENFRKRSEREREVHRAQVKAQLLRELLPILEAFDHARSAVERLPPTDPLRKGIDLLGKEWEAFLRIEGVERVARVGGRFHPDTHDAVAESAASEATPPGTVVEVVQQGYRFSGGLLRPAKVVVARARPSPSAAASASAAVAASPEGDDRTED
ncbi:MAG: nucleotide exchange factor GrpE [Thermoplasmata archaeon]